MPDQQRMYKDLAWIWPIISPPEDYEEEAEQFRKAILNHSSIEVKTLLDIGCGGGHNDSHLKKHFEVTGVDLSEGMLANARKLNPEVRYLRGDMRDFRLDEKFDAVIIADSIMYMLNREGLRLAFRTAFDHLKEGGVFCTYVEETPERFMQYGTEVSTGRKGDIEISYIESVHDPDVTDTNFETVFVYIIRRGGQIAIETDSHICGIFPLETWERTLKDVGFEVSRELLEVDDGYPMFVCVKPQS